MNKNYPFKYNDHIFNRNFLNCSQRQAFLHLDNKGYAIAKLFRNCLIDFDSIYHQTIQNPIPRYDFICNGLSNIYLNTIGINRSVILAKILDK